jgi:hypothetical protein
MHDGDSRQIAAPRNFDLPYVGFGSFASKAAETVLPCNSAALPKADVNSAHWPPTLCADIVAKVPNFPVLIFLL